MASRRHLVEVNQAIRAAGLDEKGRDAHVIGFARDLARRLDQTGSDAAPLNLLKLYQSAMKDLQRAIDRESSSKRVRNGGEEPTADEQQSVSPPALTIVEESPLDRLRREKENRTA